MKWVPFASKNKTILCWVKMWVILRNKCFNIFKLDLVVFEATFISYLLRVAIDFEAREWSKENLLFRFKLAELSDVDGSQLWNFVAQWWIIRYSLVNVKCSYCLLNLILILDPDVKNDWIFLIIFFFDFFFLSVKFIVNFFTVLDKFERDWFFDWSGGERRERDNMF